MKTNHHIIDLFPIPTFVIEKNNFEIIYCNSKALTLTQLNAESVQNCKISDFIEKSLIKVGEFENCRFRINEQTCYKGNLTVQSFGDENLIISFWSTINIVDIAGTEEKKDFTEITKALIDLSTDSIFIMQNGIIRYANPNLLQASGYNESELIGAKFTEFVNPNELEKVNSIYANRTKGDNTPLKYESSARIKNGKFFDVEVSVMQINFEGTKALQVVLREITKRKLAERKYQKIIDFAPIGFYQTSRNGDFILANEEMINILGYENSDELLSMNISDFYYSVGEREKLIKKHDTKESSEIKNYEVKFRKKDGSAIWVLMTTRAIKEENGDTISYDGFIIDISERKKNELQLMNRIRLEELFNEISSQFVQGNYLETDNLIHSALTKIGIFTNVDRVYVFQFENDGTLMNNTHEWCNNEIEPQINNLQQLPVDVFPWWMNKMNKFEIIKHDNISDLPIEASAERTILEEQNIISILVLPMISEGKLIGFIGFDSVKNKKSWIDYDVKMLETISDLISGEISRNKGMQELKKSQIAAEEGEKRYKSLFYDNSSVMLLIDPDTGNIVDTNRAACSYYGYSYQQLKTLKIRQINTLSEPEIQIEMQKALKEERQHFNFKHRLANGEIRDVESYAGKVKISGKDFLYSIIHDISERKKAEKEVLKLRIAIEQSPISIVITDLEGKIEYLNPFSAELTGYEINELIGKNPKVFSSGIHPKAFYKELWDTILSGNVWQGEMRNKKKNGEFYWEQAIISPIKNNDGKITHFVGIKEDITEKREINKQLIFLANSLEQVGECVSITDNEDILLYVNNAFADTYGYSKADLIGKHIGLILLDDIKPSQVKKHLYETKKGNWKGEHMNKKADGSLFPILLSTSVVEDENNNQIAFIGVARDITELNKHNDELIAAKEKAEENKKRFKCLIENAPDAVVIIDKEGRLIYASPNASRHFGYSENEIIGHSGHEFTHPDDLDIVYGAFNTIVRNPEQKATVQYRFRKRNGEYRWIETTFTNLLDDKTIAGFVLNYSDITEKKQVLEDLVIAKEKAEESDRLKSAFLANMSHEIRTPMNGILGFTSLLLEPDLSDDTKEEFIQIIHKSGERMLNTVNDIVEISKIEAGLVEVRKSDLDVIEILKNLDDFFKLQAKEKGLILSLENKSEETKLKINTDKSKFESILTNLIRNAIKYTDSGKIEVSVGIMDRFVQFCVKDTGIGVPQNRIKAIFNRFEQADIADNRAFQGSGLGLAIAKSYVEMLGGKIWVESIEGKGSTFCFTVPNLSETMMPDLNFQDEKTENQEKQLTTLKILIVEDDEVSAGFLEIILKDFAKKIIQANSGEQAIELCKINPDIDVVFMDIKMKGINGFEATKRIREFNKNVIIIAQTAFALSGDREKAIDAGCNDYISKPINKDELLSLIQKYFKK